MRQSDSSGSSKVEDRDVRKPQLCFGANDLPNQSVIASRLAQFQAERHFYKTASVTISPPSQCRWDYRAEAVLSEDGEKVLTGVCVKAEQSPKGDIVLSLHDFSWYMQNTKVRTLSFFGMTHREIMYWLPLLSGLVQDVHVDGLAIDDSLRPFYYAVPLQGLTANGESKSIFVSDFGVVVGEMDNVFLPLIKQMEADKKDAAWHPDIPKALGVVLATGMLQAERRALRRAQFTADIVNFALSAGLSHFETRYGAQFLSWDAINVQSTVSLYPWIILSESSSPKGWIRSVPLTDKPSLADFGQGIERIHKFSKWFLTASHAGDIQDQTGRRALTDRERKLASGIQRSLKWCGNASREVDLNDQFLATWIALEAILECMEYPKLFAGNRLPIRDSLLQTIKQLDVGNADTDNELLAVTPAMLQGRLLQDTWPLKKKLEIFARSFGVNLLPGDLRLVGDLGRVRGKILHAGRDDSEVTIEQLRSLRYLVERLLTAASVGAYYDLEDYERHQLQFGRLGAQGGAAPLSLDGRVVSYQFTISSDAQGNQGWECAIEGKIYNDANSTLTHA